MNVDAISQYFSNPGIVALWVGKIAAVQILLSSVEYLKIRDVFAAGGILSWDILNHARCANFRERNKRILSRVYGRSGMIALHIVRGVLAMLLLCSETLGMVASLGATLLLASFAINFRTFFGDDGSDQMAVIALLCSSITAGLTVLLPDSPASKVPLVFLAFQLILSYFSSGAAKLSSPTWRSRVALSEILNHHSYGNSFVARHGLHNLKVVGWVTYYVMFMQTAFPLVLTPYEWIAVPLLVSGLTFHLFVALIMGINGFVPAFLAGYPALIWLRNETPAFLMRAFG